MAISIRQVSKSFGKQQVLDQLSLEIEPGQLVTLLGPSGCGKTTLLRIIAGLDAADRGHIFFDGHDTAQWDFRQRNVGFVFQNYALFRHLTVAENIAFGLKMRARKDRPSRAAQDRKIAELLELVQLEAFGKRYPHQLSGGQCQRVALARALAIEPRILLLDEPFGALDAKVRKDLRTWLRDLQQELRITCVLVTHDQEEALDISDHIVLINQGRIEQAGAPEQLFEHPATPFALSFLSQAQNLRGLSRAQVGTNGLETLGSPVYVRPHEVQIERRGANASGMAAAIRRISVRGSTARLQLDAFPGEKSPLLAAEISRDLLDQLALQVGDEILWKPKRVHSY